ncbi:polyhomeotic-like protein 3 [Nephila pilipes]|uniref:Polyhomeotic-like protein 3 n=1 Tax=Nephila pilipes TaxID=299642 RepID=A0A8X6UKW8_NEPPI|nr:polyhomeotic-like protein 3 [Nephila pilipes]
MADENHTQMLIQQQPPPSQQSHMQSSQLQSSQAQQSQLQQSQLQQSQLQQSQLQQAQLQQSQLQQTQLQQSQLQQTQLQQSQLQQSQLQQPQIQQAQLQQTQLQQTQLQQQSQLQQSQMQQQSTSMQQQPQQQGVAAAMSMGSSVEQSNMNVTSSVPINVATINVSQPQQLQAIQQNVNTSSGTPVQMAVSQLTAQAQTLPAGTMMSQSSGPHPTMMHPTMTMAQAPLQQVQVIQQPLSTSYLQHLYSPQQQMLFPGNLTLQHAGMTTSTLQNLGATQGLSLQLQAKTTLDPKTSGGQNIQAVNSANKQAMAVNAGTMMAASGQVIGTSKSNFPQQMMTAPGKSTIIHSQSGYAPTNANQTVVIGQFGVLPNQQSIFNPKALADSQKGKTYTFQNQPAALQPKSLYSSTLPVHSSTQVFNGSHLKQISSQPQIITTQAPGTMFSQAQLLGLQTLSPLPPGLSWAAPGCLQSTALQLGQNPIIIRSQQSDMFIQQTQPQAAMHLPVAAAAAQPVPPTSFASTSIAPQKQKQVKVRPGTQTVAVATQTNVSSAATINSNSTPVRSQIKPKVRTLAGPSPGVSPSPSTPQMATTQTQTNQSPPQPPPQPVMQQKSDAGNQTYSNPVKVVNIEAKATGIQSKSVSVETKHISTSPQKSQAMVAPSSKIPQASVTPTIDISVSTAPSTLTTISSTTSVLTTTTTTTPVQVNTSVSSVESITPAVPSISPVPPVPCLTNKVVPESNLKSPLPEAQIEPVVSSVQTSTTEAVAATEHLKPQQPIQKPSLGPVKDKQPQKAIVKPQVLTHVIEGLVIQEGSEPFPVSRSALLDSPCRILPSEKHDSPIKRKDSPTVASPEKKMKAHRPRGGPGRKKKFRGRKGLRKQVQIEEVEMNTNPIEENTSAPDDDSTVSNKTEEENSEPPSDSPHPVPAEVDKSDVEMKPESDVTQKLPTKWTVQDVFEFIQNLPGCSDYADTFKSQEIDGQALLLLKEDHLMTAMCMKLGPALKLISQIRSMKEELGQS